MPAPQDVQYRLEAIVIVQIRHQVSPYLTRRSVHNTLYSIYHTCILALRAIYNSHFVIPYLSKTPVH